MKRRTLLSRAAGGLGLLVGGVGVAAATDGVVRSRLRVRSRDVPPEPEIDVTCTERRVRIDGVLVGSDSCATAAIRDAAFADGTLRVVVEETPIEGVARPCLQVLIGVDYVADVVVDGEPEVVQVVHDSVDDTTEAHLCEIAEPLE